MKTFLKIFEESFLTGLKRALKLCFKITLIIIPVYFVVFILKYTGALKYISEFLSPVMKIFGLPGNAAIVLIAADGINVYGGLAAIDALEKASFTIKQITIIGTMVGISHALPIESTILKGIEIPRYLHFIIRLSVAIIIGILLNILLWWL